MNKICIFLSFFVAACYGETTPKPVFCGAIPSKLLECIKSPHILPPEMISKCQRDQQASECDRLTCAFRENKWLNGENVDKPKVIAYMTQLAKDKPEWKTVIDHVVPTCLERDLPPQGVLMKCPAYDIMHCILIGFIQKAPDSQWTTSTECTYPRQFAGACPVCPEDCFAPVVPYGSCNACYRVPAKPTA